MKIQLLVSTGVVLLALLPGCHECRALSKGLPVAPAPDSSASQPSDFPDQLPPSLPVLLRMGEEYFLRLGSLRKNPASSSSSSSSSSSLSSTSSSSHLAATGNFLRAAAQQLHQLQQLQERSLGGAAAIAAVAAAEQPWEEGGGAPEGAHAGEAPPKEKRSEEPPISLDLTFHLLREVLEMARAEQLAQQAHSNRKLMEIIGK
ncbi:corticoliberin [Anolis carolinensis]|uniref:Corticotropin releasing hormone n=1 Tax=Anolis carolinensis TaxID=28377 RepID=G1KSW8_ANOCA|nr:PREDICTED: corticoliberin [Anolis carolinensis]XP_008106738.1 PREDICTED: corticoliberin [Anolis carolinensis]|eukprot:XP_008106737.1 PREDICTED: corticoliberin [Anolis carolinensis]